MISIKRSDRDPYFRSFRSITGSLVRPLPKPLQISLTARLISPIACFIRYKDAAPAVVRIQPGERHAAEPPTT